MSLSSLRAKVRSGLLWTSLHSLIARLINFAVLAVLARLLAPADFGLLGMVLVAQGVVQSVSELGLQGAVVQRRDPGLRELSSMYWLGASSALFFGAVLFLAAPLVAGLFEQPALDPLVRASAGILLVGQFGAVPMGLLRKRMRLDAIARIELASSGIASAAGVVAALSGAGVWSLVLQAASMALLRTLFAHRAADYRPTLVFDRDAVGWVLRHARDVVASGLLGQAAHQADKFVLGRFVGAASLGLYTRAYALADLLSSSISSVTSQVLFPALSRLDDDARTRTVIQRALAATGFVLLPVSFGIACLARPVIVVLYGDRWLLAAPLLEVLSISLLLARLSAPVSMLFVVKGRTDLLLKWSFAAALAFVAAIGYSGRFADPHAVAVAHAVVSVLTFVPRLYLAGRLIGLGVGPALKPLASSFACSLLMALVVLGARDTVFAGASAVVQLVGLGALGALVYLGLAASLKLEPLRQLRRLVH